MIHPARWPLQLGRSRRTGDSRGRILGAPFRQLIEHLEQSKLIETPKGRKDLVEVTERGREVFADYESAQQVAQEIAAFFHQE